jgi:hypothetical protein
MNLKNYTSEVPAITSMGRIERCLVEAGATDISKKYEDGICRAIRFRMPINNIPVFFELPARVDSCYKVLWADVKRPRPDTKKKIEQQAERTAWKIICEWVECQLSMIKLEQAEALQVFLPYVWDPAKEETFFEKLKKTNYKALLPG